MAGSENIHSFAASYYVLCISETPCSASTTTILVVDSDNLVLDRITSNPVILGAFDKAVTVLKEGKKRRHKKLIFRNLSEFDGSLHNRAIRKAVKFKSKEVQSGGSRNS